MLCAVLLLLSSGSFVFAAEAVNRNQSCELPPQPSHGVYTNDSVDKPVLNFTCDEGYVLSGAATVSCVNGTWLETFPKCIESTVFATEAASTNRDQSREEPPQPSHGVYTNDSVNSVDQPVLYSTCDVDYVVPGTECIFSRFMSVLFTITGNELAPLKKHLDPVLYSHLRSITFTFLTNVYGPLFQTVIGGGAKVNIKAVPWQAGIYTKKNRPYMQVCGGSLVSHYVVISAAHCFWGNGKEKPASQFAVALGKSFRPWGDPHDEGAQKFEIQSIRIPPRYQGAMTNNQDDIALVILESYATFTEYVKPVHLSFDHVLEAEQLVPGHYGLVAGWGLTSEEGEASPTLKVVNLPYIALKRCISESPPNYIVYITSDKICAGYKNGTALCKGDSGGGLMFPKEVPGQDTQFYLQGIVSTAPVNDHKCNVQSWATFTKISKHERFILGIQELI